MSTSALKRGEIAMSIAPDSAMYNASAIDLAKCSAPLDITENGWFLAAPTEVTKTGAAADAVTHDAAKALPLIVNAKMQAPMSAMLAALLLFASPTASSRCSRPATPRLLPLAVSAATADLKISA